MHLEKHVNYPGCLRPFWDNILMPTSLSRIRLLLADDHEVVRIGLKTLLSGTEIAVTEEVGSGTAAVKAALETDFDLILLDIRMPDGDGLTALGRIKLERPSLPVLMLSTYDNPTYVARGFRLGRFRLPAKVVLSRSFDHFASLGRNGRESVAP